LKEKKEPARPCEKRTGGGKTPKQVQRARGKQKKPPGISSRDLPGEKEPEGAVKKEGGKEAWDPGRLTRRKLVGSRRPWAGGAVEKGVAKSRGRPSRKKNTRIRRKNERGIGIRTIVNFNARGANVLQEGGKIREGRWWRYQHLN